MVPSRILPPLFPRLGPCLLRSNRILTAVPGRPQSEPGPLWIIAWNLVRDYCPLPNKVASDESVSDLD